jgi:hypothetical protein
MRHVFATTITQADSATESNYTLKDLDSKRVARVRGAEASGRERGREEEEEEEEEESRLARLSSPF